MFIQSIIYKKNQKFVSDLQIKFFKKNHNKQYKTTYNKIFKKPSNKEKMPNDEQEISYATNKKNIKRSKIVFVGDQYVGKTSVITRFIKNSFDSQKNPTIGVDFISKNISIGGKMMRLQLWDTAGQQRFRSLIPNYVRDCQVALIVFDLTNYQSFQNIPKWIDFIKEHRGDDQLLIVVGNKLDLKEEKKVSDEAIREKFTELGIKHFEVSAKTGENIQKMFQSICSQLMELKSDTNLPIEVMQSKLVTNVTLEKQSSFKQKKQVIKLESNPTKLTKMAGQSERRLKQKDCC